MAEMEKRRVYLRDNYLNSDAEISGDGVKKTCAVVFNISAGGLKFRSNKEFKSGDILHLKMSISELPREININAQIKICRVEPDENGETFYSASFVDLSPKLRIQLDEIILYKKRKHHPAS